jgi:hypothetical protein
MDPLITGNLIYLIVLLVGFGASSFWRFWWVCCFGTTSAARYSRSKPC